MGTRCMDYTVGSERKKRRKRLMTRISASQMKVLPTGWNKIQKIRATGKTKGTVDSYFISPSGQQFRSMREVERHFGSGGLSIDSGYVPQRKNKKRKVESSSSESDSDDDSVDSDGSGSSEDPSSSEEDEDDSDEESEEEDSEEEESEEESEESESEEESSSKKKKKRKRKTSPTKK